MRFKYQQRRSKNYSTGRINNGDSPILKHIISISLKDSIIGLQAV